MIMVKSTGIIRIPALMLLLFADQAIKMIKGNHGRINDGFDPEITVYILYNTAKMDMSDCFGKNLFSPLHISSYITLNLN